uniref:Uncharacterized protein n=1 Tax=Monomastix sp. (strain OKE-1) TaxID=141716 RepID=U5YDQ6_MONSK|nr:hypothetical protein [Monomastix sp. OKE-1]AGZ90214.1 hypothetical protein [Monomastix sp. OKE-1]
MCDLLSNDVRDRLLTVYCGRKGFAPPPYLSRVFVRLADRYEEECFVFFLPRAKLGEKTSLVLLPAASRV